MRVRRSDLTSAVFEISIETDADGVISVGWARVTLDTLVAASNEGATAEEIVHLVSDFSSDPSNKSVSFALDLLR